LKNTGTDEIKNQVDMNAYSNEYILLGSLAVCGKDYSPILYHPELRQVTKINTSKTGTGIKQGQV
jgi:hypothetical protein